MSFAQKLQTEKDLVLTKQDLKEMIQENKTQIETQIMDKNTRLEGMIESLRTLLAELHDETKQKAINSKVDQRLTECQVQLEDLKLIQKNQFQQLVKQTQQKIFESHNDLNFELRERERKLEDNLTNQIIELE